VAEHRAKGWKPADPVRLPAATEERGAPA